MHFLGSTFSNNVQILPCHQDDLLILFEEYWHLFPSESESFVPIAVVWVILPNLWLFCHHKLLVFVRNNALVDPFFHQLYIDNQGFIKQ